MCGLPMRGRAEDLVGAHASSRGHSCTKSSPAQSMSLTLLHVALRRVAIPHVNIPRTCCSPFLWLLCFLTSSCAVDAFQLPPAARAASLGPVHQVEQFDPVHRAGTSARIGSCVMCSTANVRDWAYWEEELALWSTKDLLQSEHADEFVAMLQTRPGWQRISAAAERCYQLGATQVLLCGPAVRDPDHIDPYSFFDESRIDLAVSGLNERELWRVRDNVQALVGTQADVIPFHLDEHRQRQYEQDIKLEWRAAKAAALRSAPEERARAIASGLDFLPSLEEVTIDVSGWVGPGVYGSMDQDILSRSLWISRCGVVRPARSFANLFFEIGVCEEARAAGHD